MFSNKHQRSFKESRAEPAAAFEKDGWASNKIDPQSERVIKSDLTSFLSLLVAKRSENGTGEILSHYRRENELQDGISNWQERWNRYARNRIAKYSPPFISQLLLFIGISILILMGWGGGGVPE